jgi:hypothetical protein
MTAPKPTKRQPSLWRVAMLVVVVVWIALVLSTFDPFQHFGH